MLGLSCPRTWSAALTLPSTWSDNAMRAAHAGDAYRGDDPYWDGHFQAVLRAAFSGAQGQQHRGHRVAWGGRRRLYRQFGDPFLTLAASTCASTLQCSLRMSEHVALWPVHKELVPCTLSPTFRV